MLSSNNSFSQDDDLFLPDLSLESGLELEEDFEEIFDEPSEKEVELNPVPNNSKNENPVNKDTNEEISLENNESKKEIISGVVDKVFGDDNLSTPEEVQKPEIIEAEAKEEKPAKKEEEIDLGDFNITIGTEPGEQQDTSEEEELFDDLDFEIENLSGNPEEDVIEEAELSVKNEEKEEVLDLEFDSGPDLDLESEEETEVTEKIEANEENIDVSVEEMISDSSSIEEIGDKTEQETTQEQVESIVEEKNGIKEVNTERNIEDDLFLDSDEDDMGGLSVVDQETDNLSDIKPEKKEEKTESLVKAETKQKPNETIKKTDVKKAKYPKSFTDLKNISFKPSYFKTPEKYLDNLSGSKGKEVITIGAEDFKNYDTGSNALRGGKKSEDNPKYREDIQYYSFEDDFLEKIGDLPTRKEKISIKKEIVINRTGDGDYQTLEASDDIDSQTADQVDLSLIEDDINSDQLRTNTEGGIEFSNKKAKKKPFYLRDQEIAVKVSSKRNVELLDYFRNAHDALKVGQYESAIAYYNAILGKNSKDKRALFGVATAYQMSKQHDLAKLTYKKLISIDRKNWKAINNYVILMIAEDPDNADERLRSLWDKHPTFAPIPAQMANVEFSKGNYEAALEYYISALKLDNDNTGYLYNLGVTYEKLKQYKMAAKVYIKVLKQSAKGAKIPESGRDLEKRIYSLMSL